MLVLATPTAIPIQTNQILYRNIAEQGKNHTRVHSSKSEERAYTTTQIVATSKHNAPMFEFGSGADSRVGLITKELVVPIYSIFSCVIRCSVEAHNILHR